jgi:hypothetical protein
MEHLARTWRAALESGTFAQRERAWILSKSYVSKHLSKAEAKSALRDLTRLAARLSQGDPKNSRGRRHAWALVAAMRIQCEHPDAEAVTVSTRAGCAAS